MADEQEIGYRCLYCGGCAYGYELDYLCPSEVNKGVHEYLAPVTMPFDAVACDKCGGEIRLDADNAPERGSVEEALEFMRDDIKGVQVEAWFAGRGVAFHRPSRAVCYQCDKCESVIRGDNPKVSEWKQHHFTGDCLKPAPAWTLTDASGNKYYPEDVPDPSIAEWSPESAPDSVEVEREAAIDYKAAYRLYRTLYERATGDYSGKAGLPLNFLDETPAPEMPREGEVCPWSQTSGYCLRCDKYHPDAASSEQVPGHSNFICPRCHKLITLCECNPLPDKPLEAGELSLLVIDLGDSCVVKVEKGVMPELCRDRGYHYSSPEDEEVAIFHRPFAEFRTAIDQLESEKPVPRIEHDPHSDELSMFTSVGQRYIPADLHAAIWGLTGVEIPVWTPKKGEWKKLNAFDWTKVREEAGAAGYGVNTASFEKALMPFEAWRYTR